VSMRPPVYLIAALCLGLSSGNLFAGYTLSRIVDDSGQFTAFSGPSINNNGTVSYQAIRNDGVQGIYSGTGTIIIDGTGQFSSFGAPSINDNNITAYQAELDSGVSGVFEGAGNKVVDSTGTFFQFSDPSINNSGELAYRAETDAGIDGIYMNAGTVVIDSNGQFSTFDQPALNNNGMVAYRAVLGSGVEGIYTDAGTKVVDSSGAFFSFSNPSVNDSATVVYAATLDDGVNGVYTGGGNKVVDSNGSFFDFGQPVINESGLIVYNAFLDTGEEGVFTGAGERVVDSSGIFESFFAPSINDSGQIVFVTRLDNGSNAIYLATPEAPVTPVDLAGTVETTGGTGLCALVLASGQFDFSCNPNGPFSLPDLPRESDGTVKRQVYVDGFFPEVDTLPGSVDETVVMTPSGNCPDYNAPYTPGVFPGSAGKWINISGNVRLQNTQTPVCAIVLANGQFMFSCAGTGSYALKIPLDANGQFTLQVYADGFAPSIQRFDEFKATTTVGLARASECRVP
jgi:hypothetical protein